MNATTIRGCELLDRISCNEGFERLGRSYSLRRHPRGDAISIAEGSAFRFLSLPLHQLVIPRPEGPAFSFFFAASSPH
jgi:hypothetical protein